MNKIDSLKQWILSQDKPFSTVQIKEFAMNFFSSADVRARELAVKGFMRVIPRREAIKRGLLKPKNANIRWYESIKKPLTLSL